MGAGFAVVLLAWLSFALAMPKHQQALLARGLSPAVARSLRLLAWMLLALGLAIFVGAKGAGQGPIFWGGSLVLAAIAWVLLLTLAPRGAVVVAASAAFGLLLLT